MTLSSKVSVSASAKLTKTLDLGDAEAPLSVAYTTGTLASGTAAGQADLVFHDKRTLAASATEDLDLAGVLLSPLGDALTFVKVKALIISASSSNTNNVVVGAAAANAWSGALNATGTVTLRPGATLALFCGAADTGYSVTAGTGDLLKVANSAAGSSVTYDIVVIGCSA